MKKKVMSWIAKLKLNKGQTSLLLRFFRNVSVPGRIPCETGRETG